MLFGNCRRLKWNWELQPEFHVQLQKWNLYNFLLKKFSGSRKEIFWNEKWKKMESSP